MRRILAGMSRAERRPRARSRRPSQTIGLSVATALVLAACGGSADDDSTTPAPAPAPAPGPAEPEDFFAGRDLSLIVPFGPGGGTDVTARAIAPLLAEYLGANSLNVVNIGGAGSIPGSNEFALRGAVDVDFFMSSATTHVAYFLNEPGVRFEMRDWRGLLGIPTGSPTSVSPKTGFTGSNYDKLLEPDVELIHSGISITGADLRTVLAYEVLGIPVRYVFGYSGLGPARLAFEQGEATSTTQSMGGYLSNVVPLVEAGLAVPLFTVGLVQGGGLVRDPVTPEIPTVQEVYEAMYGESPSGASWEALLFLISAQNVMQKALIMHKDTPDAKFEQAQAAVEAMLLDPRLSEVAKAAFGDYEPFIGEAVEEQLRRIAEPDPEVISWLYDFLTDEWNVKLTPRE